MNQCRCARCQCVRLGIVLFLSVVGLKSGGQFLETLVQGPGASWLLYGMLITLLPLLIVGLLARHLWSYQLLVAVVACWRAP